MIDEVRLSRRAVGTLALLGVLSACKPAGNASATAPQPSSLPSGAADPSAGDGLASVQPGAPASSGAPTRSPSPAAAAQRAPAQTFTVSVKSLNLSRATDRPLRTLVSYPTAAGRYPLVLFSHGLHGTPEAYQNITKSIAAAGFVVAAPAYPFTNGNAASFNAGDMANQPADASYVIGEVLKQDGSFGTARIDATRIGAAGHSAGGYTTVGMLSGKTRDTRLKAGIVIAGGQLGGSFTGPAASVLFVHGDKDNVVPYSTGRAAFGKVSWPKAMLTLIGGDHGNYLFGSSAMASAASRTMLDFLRWALDHDTTARDRLPEDASVAGVSTFESVGIFPSAAPARSVSPAPNPGPARAAAQGR